MHPASASDAPREVAGKIERQLDEVAHAHAGRVDVRLALAENAWVLSVADDGPGISPKDLEHLFERFYKGENGKFGIGLSLAQSCVEHMGGTLRAYNRERGAVLEAILQPWTDTGAS